MTSLLCLAGWWFCVCQACDANRELRRRPWSVAIRTRMLLWVSGAMATLTTAAFSWWG